jgi:hypothetical protein
MRYEINVTFKIFFKSTSAYKNRDQILQVLEKHGAINDCQAGR